MDRSTSKVSATPSISLSPFQMTPDKRQQVAKIRKTPFLTSEVDGREEKRGRIILPSQSNRKASVFWRSVARLSAESGWETALATASSIADAANTKLYGKIRCKAHSNQYDIPGKQKPICKKKIKSQIQFSLLLKHRFYGRT